MINMTSFPNINQRKRQGVTRKITQYGFLLLTEWLLTQTNCTFGWRLIILQYRSVFFFFFHTLTWISHGFTCVPHSNPLSHISTRSLWVFPVHQARINAKKKKNCTFSTFIAFTFKIKMTEVNHQLPWLLRAFNPEHTLPPQNPPSNHLGQP